jgi:hypothetical protein
MVTMSDGVTEIVVLAVVIWLASSLQMTMEKKFTVCLAFVWRLGWVLLSSWLLDPS